MENVPQSAFDKRYTRWSNHPLFDTYVTSGEDGRWQCKQILPGCPSCACACDMWGWQGTNSTCPILISPGCPSCPSSLELAAPPSRFPTPLASCCSLGGAERNENHVTWCDDTWQGVLCVTWCDTDDTWQGVIYEAWCDDTWRILLGIFLKIAN